jgi:membrane protein
MATTRHRSFPGRKVVDFAVGVARKVGSDRILLLSSGLAYGATLSLAPLVIVTLGLVGLVADRGQVEQYFVDQMQRVTGADTAGLVGQVAESQRAHGSGVLATIIGSITLVIGASAVFIQLQDGLNIIWNVTPKPGHSLFTFLRKRLLSLAMLVSLGFLLLVSLLASSLLTALLDHVSTVAGIKAVAGVVANIVMTLLLSGVLFALLFRFVPDARTRWRDVLLGGAVTAVLFHAGQWAISQYLARAAVGSPYGAAGSIVALLVWVYYSAVIVFVGAEFTQQWAVRRGGGTVPEPHAKRGNPAVPRPARAATQR